MHAVDEGNLDRIKLLVAQGKGTPHDVDESVNSLLAACKQYSLVVMGAFMADRIVDRELFPYLAALQ